MGADPPTMDSLMEEPMGESRDAVPQVWKRRKEKGV
jgi:hypothetical protein